MIVGELGVYPADAFRDGCYLDRRGKHKVVRGIAELSFIDSAGPQGDRSTFFGIEESPRAGPANLVRKARAEEVG